jgi:hypothetical protein
VSLEPGTEAGLIASGQASATLTGGNPYSPPPGQKQKRPVMTEFDPADPGGGVGITQIVSLTQAQYDAIATKDPATLYVIVEG